MTERNDSPLPATPEKSSTDKAKSPPRKTSWLRLIASWGVVLALLVALWIVFVQVALWRAAAALEARRTVAAKYWLYSVSWTGRTSGEQEYLLARLERRLENYPAVEKHLRKALELGWDPQELEREQWLVFAQTGQFQQIDRYWPELFMDSGSDGPEICAAYVNHALSQFRIDDAIRVLDTWSATYPDDAEPIYQRGRIALVVQAWPSAVEEFEKALEINPEHFDAHVGLADAQMKRLRFQQAIPAWRWVVNERSDDSLSWSKLARCLIQVGEVDEADTILKQQLEKHPGHYELSVARGQLLLQQGKAAEAVKELQVAADIHPEDSDTRYMLAQALQANGQAAEAVEHLRFVDEATKELLKLSKLTERLVANPGDVELRYQVAEITWRYRSHEDGFKWLKSLLNYHPSHEATHALLAEHYRNLGDEESAKRHEAYVRMPQEQ